MLIDARSVDGGSMFEFDLAVVGAGPAGISLVDRLRDSGLSIAPIEGGGLHPELKTQRLYHGETVGDDYVHRRQLRVHHRGYANPTFTIVALALRLADHLQQVLRS